MEAEVTAPCSRCLRTDCEGICTRLADGTRNERLVGQRVVVAYSHTHQRKGESPIAETRHAFGKVAKVLPDGWLWVVTDRDGGVRVEASCVEVVQ
jgi:hypothetical protein